MAHEFSKYMCLQHMHYLGVSEWWAGHNLGNHILGKIPWRRKRQPLQYSCLENPMARGAWQATVCGVAPSRTRLKQYNTHTHPRLHTPLCSGGWEGRDEGLQWVWTLQEPRCLRQALPWASTASQWPGTEGTVIVTPWIGDVLCSHNKGQTLEAPTQ